MELKYTGEESGIWNGTACLTDVVRWDGRITTGRLGPAMGAGPWALGPGSCNNE